MDEMTITQDIEIRDRTMVAREVAARFEAAARHAADSARGTEGPQDAYRVGPWWQD